MLDEYKYCFIMYYSLARQKRKEDSNKRSRSIVFVSCVVRLFFLQYPHCKKLFLAVSTLQETASPFFSCSSHTARNTPAPFFLAVSTLQETASPSAMDRAISLSATSIVSNPNDESKSVGTIHSISKQALLINFHSILLPTEKMM